ncbi:predicted protein [Uncinocarpus reesii 1704]|uniref:Nucleoporin NSP1 n=1 Tax=Uncinocarpus reesii (strain UAMH 1704) TaxID=336963 RepID=C4JJD9_UNCRE|nr:uncharacterized protein UREG_01746 [Uncinocarpus reesii 1704]EEP76897.1 predicted protein [Uncinocarpus reesii 1704]
MAHPFQFGTSTGGGASTTPTSSIFGQNTSSAAGAGGLFGNIGSGQTPSASQQPSFGGGAGTPLFGQTPPAASSAFSLKPAEQNNPSIPSFGITPNKPAESGQQKPGNLFGEVGKPGSMLFGSATPAPASGGMFGNPSTTPAGPPPAATSGQSGSLFTQTAQNAAGGPTLFGSKPATMSQPESTKPAITIGGGMFAGAGTSGTAPAFGSNALFGNLSGVGQAGAKPGKEEGKPTLLMNSPASTPTTTQTSSTTAEKPAQSTFSFPPTTATQHAPATTAPATGGLFGGGGATKTSAPSDASTAATTTQAPAMSIFSLTKPPGTTSAAPSLGTPATTSAPAVTAPTTTTTTAPTTSAPSTTAPATSAAGTAALGASTVGPPPPAQSRLKNKTMDEIITRWATDLTKYQKEFQEQAEQVAEWDRMLVENGSKVQKLYGNTVDAERATQEVERQLAAVEGQQDELSSWLDRYEQEVESLLSKQVGAGDSLQGPDQERERTYKLAERLSERLNDMGQDLTSMIEEVNSASTNLSKTSKADEPISQIVRILNSHLSQLQLIDQGTAALRAKIQANQRAGSSLSQSQYGAYRNGTPGSVSGGAAEDFYRAYMGRR